MSKQIIMTKGLPASGKSTWANKFVNERQGWMLVSNDAIRKMCFARTFSKQDTKYVESARKLLIQYAIDNGLNFVIDNTNLHPKHEANYKRIAEENGYTFEVKDFTDIPFHECIQRDGKRKDKVGAYTILDMYNRFLKPEGEEMATMENMRSKMVVKYAERFILEQDKTLPKAILCDLDGTLAHIEHRNPYDASNCHEDDLCLPVHNCLVAMRNQGYKIIFLSGRSEDYKEPTLRFLKEKVEIEDFMLYMRKSGDFRKDSIIKKELYEENIKGKYFVEFILDDRNQVVDLWRSLGLVCFQVAPGDF